MDILIPAALENQINDFNVQAVAPSVKLIVEGANGPTSETAEATLQARGVTVIPDLLANAGGVLCSYFEQIQAASNQYWTLAEVMSRLDHQLTSAFFEVGELSRTKGLTLRDAALVLGIDRVVSVSTDRGWV